MASALKATTSYVGDGELLKTNITFSNQYPTGGEKLTGRELGLTVGSRVDAVRVNPSGGRKFEWLPTPGQPHEGKLRVLDDRGEDFLLNRPSLQIGTGNAAEVRNNTAFTKSVGGMVVEVAAGETAFGGAGDDISADADKIQEALYLLEVNAAGNITIVKGSTADEGEATAPPPQAATAQVGTVLVQVAAGIVDFDSTTDLLTATHLTVTFLDADGETPGGTDLSGLTVRATVEGR